MALRTKQKVWVIPVKVQKKKGGLEARFLTLHLGEKIRQAILENKQLKM
jgi:hypothetical protein